MRHASILLAIAFVVGASPARAKEVTLAKGGRAQFPVRIAADAGQRIHELAETLRGYLSQISGAKFEVQTGGDAAGIVLRVEAPEELSIFDRERYAIRTQTGGVLLTGTTEDALEHAVWDFLYRLGYRQFFPGKTWEVVLRRETLRVDLDVTESPDYHFRRIWYGYGTWDYNREPWEDWCRKNRLGGSLQVQSGHAYGGIIRAKQKEFDEHPEYYALVEGKRQVKPQAKLCIGNPDLRRTVVEYARDYFERNPEADCVSMDPIDVSDGHDMTEVTWPDGQRMTIKMSLADHPRTISGRWNLWFYVPPGVEKIGLYVDTAAGEILRPDGESAESLDRRRGEFVGIEVPAGMDGKLWKLNHIAGTVCLMNVPPYLARSPQELLLPAEVVRNPRKSP